MMIMTMMMITIIMIMMMMMMIMLMMIKMMMIVMSSGDDCFQREKLTCLNFTENGLTFTSLNVG